LLAIALAVPLALAALGEARVAHAQAPSGVFEQDAVDVDAPEGVDIVSVRVDNRLGDVSVRGHDKPGIAIQSFKRAADKETLERLVVSLVPDAKGGVQIRTTLKAGPESRPIAAGSIAVDLVVLVPHSAMVEAELWKGNLRVSGIDNGAKLLVDRGRIEVKQVSGVIVSDLRKGEQEFAEVLGELEASGIEGALTLNAIRGKRLQANLVRGTIHGEGLKVDTMRVQSVFGDIELVVEPTFNGQYRVASRKGNVEVRFHGATPVSLKVYAAKALLSPEFGAEQDGEDGPWRGHFGSVAKSETTVRPAQLEIRAGAGRVLVKHF
tara:strand:- start:73458 stop:74423 length:966 start_codon:yes stop_codon:yes gene_type:complete